jgi:hypothetical protein
MVLLEQLSFDQQGEIPATSLANGAHIHPRARRPTNAYRSRAKQAVIP